MLKIIIIIKKSHKNQPLEIGTIKIRGVECLSCYGNMALETVLFAELFYNPAVKWGVAVCSGASLSRAYYLTE